MPDDDDQPGVLIDLWFEGWTGVGPRAGLSLFQVLPGPHKSRVTSARKRRTRTTPTPLIRPPPRRHFVSEPSTFLLSTIFTHIFNIMNMNINLLDDEKLIN